MNVYHCMIELRPECRPLAFASAVENWMAYLAGHNLVGDWRLLRRKLGLATDRHTDFVLEVEIDGLSSLDTAFAAIAASDDAAEQLYERMHQMIAKSDVGLYRPYPDAAQRETIALI